jgi:mRNA interferase RelE/StbE
VPHGYSLVIQPSVARDIRRIPKDHRKRIQHRMDSLIVNPRPPGTKKIADPAVYRVRQGDYRIIYEVDDKARTVIIFRIRHRRELYRS